MHRLLLMTTLALMTASGANAQTLLADTNKDGKVTQAEYQDSRRTFLMRADRNKDGKISAAEWTKGADEARFQARQEGVDGWPLVGKAGLFTTLDTNKDGFVTPPEIDAYYGPRFAKLDPNHDGVVTRTEAYKIEKAVK
jgi:Ca2+-binding EF-hand superfamily protein